MQFLVLATGSKGNCAFVGTPHSNVLIDCGIPLRSVFGSLRSNGIDPAHLDALLLTHIHSDHIRSIAALLRKHALRVYCPAAHLGYVAQLLAKECVDAELVAVEANVGFFHHDLDILPVPVSHDCSPTLMYKLHCGNHTCGVLTDLGCTDERLGRIFADCDVLLLESNHCVNMLHAGRYPEHLKRRIRGAMGHLSNDEAAQFSVGLERMPRYLLLGHLSDDNNRPEAASAAFNRIEYGGLIPHTVIPQRTLGTLITLA